MPCAEFRHARSDGRQMRQDEGTLDLTPRACLMLLRRLAQGAVQQEPGAVRRARSQERIPLFAGRGSAFEISDPRLDQKLDAALDKARLPAPRLDIFRQTVGFD